MGGVPARRAGALILLILLLVGGLTSCLARRRVITRKGANGSTSLITADKTSLIERIRLQYARVRDLSATVDMVPALGTAEKSKITEYKDVRGYILFRKPNQIRIIGLYPVVRNKAFDMVSDGKTFRLYVPVKDRFITGLNEAPLPPSKNKLENLRPQHFVDALFIEPPKANGEHAVLENLTDEDDANYIVHLIADGPKGELRLARSVWFDRLNLGLVRQLVYDAAGNILTDARYRDWQVYDGIPFPKQIDITRPQDEYAVVLTIAKMDVNKGIGDDKFILEQPEGSTLQVLSDKSERPQKKQ